MKTSYVICLLLIVPAIAYKLHSVNIFDYKDYLISYNYTTGQANYALAICRKISQQPPCRWKPSPNITSNDYKGGVVDRSHLIPNSEYGPSTCEITNAVPMYARFNRGGWKNIESYLRKYYVGKVIIRGCQYEYGEMISPPEVAKSMYLPLGCYYVVTSLVTMTSFDNFYVLEHGYIKNTRDNSGSTVDEMPWWIEQDEKPEKNHSDLFLIIIIIGAIFMSCLIITCAIIVLTRRRFVKYALKEEDLYNEL